MDWCVSFPKEQMLMVRPSLRRSCGGNRNAAKLLSYLLYHASAQGEHVEQGVVIFRTQGQIVEDMDEELSSRTLRDEAIPCLTDLGYISCQEFKGNKQYTAYTIYPAVIQTGINDPESIPDYKNLPYYKNKADRKIFRSEKIPNGSENFPNGSEKSPNGQAQGLGKFSERKKASKPASKQETCAISEVPKIKEINSKTEEKKEEGPSIKRNGLIEAVLRPLCIDFDEMRDFDDHSVRVCAIYQQSGSDLDTFRAKIQKLHQTIYNNPLPDGWVSRMDYFYYRLCKAFKVSELAPATEVMRG